jgi:hypothetical protein
MNPDDFVSGDCEKTKRVTVSQFLFPGERQLCEVVEGFDI